MGGNAKRNRIAARRLTPRAKLGISLVGLAILISAMLVLALYANVRSQLRRDLQERLHDIVGIAAMQIDGDAHSTLNSPADEGNTVYMRIKQGLQRIRDASSDVSFVYTMRQNADGQIVFVVDAETDPIEISHLGDVYHDAGPGLAANFATLERAAVEKEFYTDRRGTWLSGYAPFYRSDGQREGVLGIDVASAEVLSREWEFVWVALAVFGAAIICVTVFGILLYRRLEARNRGTG